MASKNWKPGDLVFAKMCGYPAWPARVEFQSKVTEKSIWYKVYFFGTKQTGVCKDIQLHPYSTNKTTLGGCKKKGFSIAMEEIEEEWQMNQLHQGENLNAESRNMASTSRATCKRASEINSPKVEKKKCHKRIDSASLEGLLRPCFVKLNRVHVPACGTVKLTKPCESTTSSHPITQVRVNRPSITPRHPVLKQTKPSVAPSVVCGTSHMVRMTSKLPPHPKSRVVQQHTLTPHSVSKSSQLPISISELAHVHTYDDVCDDPQYECIFCDSAFLTFDQLHSHCSVFHGRYSFCRKCKKYFKSSKQLMLHEAMCLSTQAREIYHCNTCIKSFVSKEFLLEHLKITHTLRRSEDGKGLIILDPYNLLLEEIREELKILTKNHVVTPCIVDCHSCSRQYSIEEYIDTHLVQSETMIQCHCSFCGIDPQVFYLEPIKYLQHIKNHVVKDVHIVRCEKCGVKLLSKYNSFTHMLHRHSDKQKLNHPELVDLEEETQIQAAEVTTTAIENVTKISAHTSTTVVCNSMNLPRISSHTSDSSINSDVEVSEYVVEVFDVAPTSQGEAPAASRKVDESCNLLSSMEISQPVEISVKDIDNFMIHCTVCSGDIRDTVYFESHIKDCARDNEFPCPLCGIDITSNDTSHFEKHLQHKMQTIRCRKCNFIFFNCHNQTLHLGNKHYNIK